MAGIADIARIIEAAGFPFLTWAEWFPGGRPDKLNGTYPGWTKLAYQRFPCINTHWVHHSVTNAMATPVDAARTVNNIGISRFGKMSYPFLIHRTGAIIQGCYPYIGAHTKNHNSTTLAGCNIGNYQTGTPTEIMVEANAALIRALRATGHYPQGITEVLGHRQSQYASTSCPGDRLMAMLPRISRLANMPPVPSTPPSLESDVFLLKVLDKPEVFLVEAGRYTHITTAASMSEIARALDVPADPAEVPKAQFDAIVKGRTRF